MGWKSRHMSPSAFLTFTLNLNGLLTVFQIIWWIKPNGSFYSQFFPSVITPRSFQSVSYCSCISLYFQLFLFLYAGPIESGKGSFSSSVHALKLSGYISSFHGHRRRNFVLNLVARALFQTEIYLNQIFLWWKQPSRPDHYMACPGMSRPVPTAQPVQPHLPRVL